jgi:broad specificity phosphatase PhoE
VLIVVRHGRTEANASGLLLGQRLDPGLDDLGRQQAARLGAVLGDVDRVVSSPLRRARETAAALAGAVEVEVDDRWVEIDYGDLDGTPLAEVPAETWARWRADTTFEPGSGESLAALGARVRAAAEELLDESRSRDIVVVTHVSPVKAAAGWALGVGDEIAWRMWCAPASITRIGASGSNPSLHAYNVTAHLDGLG